MSEKLLLESWDKTHHAYVLSGIEPSAVWQELRAKLNFESRANPDALELELETLGIDDVRGLIDWAIMRPLGGERKVAVISANSISVEAQNALLKLLEEPTLGTYFFIILPTTGSLLPTLLSRVRVVKLVDDTGDVEVAEKFINASVAERVKMAEALAKSKDKHKSKQLISELERYYYGGEQKEMNQNILREIMKAEKYLSSRAPSPRMIFEYLALILPSK